MIATKTKKKARARSSKGRGRLKPGISHDIKELQKHKQLEVDDLMKLVIQMRDTEDIDEASRLSDEIMKGFYGTK